MRELSYALQRTPCEAEFVRGRRRVFATSMAFEPMRVGHERAERSNGIRILSATGFVTCGCTLAPYKASRLPGPLAGFSSHLSSSASWTMAKTWSTRPTETAPPPTAPPALATAAAEVDSNSRACWAGSARPSRAGQARPSAQHGGPNYDTTDTTKQQGEGRTTATGGENGCARV